MFKSFLANKRVFRFTIASLVLLPLAIVFIAWYIQKSEEGDIEYSIQEHTRIKDKVYFFGKQKEYILFGDGDLNFGGHFVYTTERKVMTRKDGEDLTDHEKIPKSDYWKLRLYNLSEEDLPVVEINLNKAVADYQSNYFPIDFMIEEYRNNPKNIIHVQVKNEKGDIKILDLNINNERIEGEYHQRSDEYENIIGFSGTTLWRTLENRGYSVNNSIQIYSQVDREAIDTNINLFKDYPEIEEKITKKDWYLRPQKQYVTSEEWFNKVLYWMAPVGEDKLTIYGMDKNGRITDSQIATYADYQAWAQKIEEERKQDEKNRSR